MGTPIRVSIDWGRSIGVSKTIPTVLVVPNPSLSPGSPVRDAAFQALQELKTENARYLAWFAYPRRAVAQLEAPTRERTFWDFSDVDAMIIPFLNSTKGRNPIVSFSTIPAWMFKTPKRVPDLTDPDRPDYPYGVHGTELVDQSGKQLADYQARVMRWYTQGGFVDEIGQVHRSGHHYDIPWWGVLNEPGHEHFADHEQYTHRYDAIVSATRAVNPGTQFMSPSLCGFYCDVDEGPEFFEYFLDAKNHEPDVPIDMLSYHFYAHIRDGGSIAEWQFSLFAQADSFINDVQYINAIRKRLSPTTKVNIDELGLRLVAESPEDRGPIPEIYWQLAAAYDTYLYVELAKRGVDVLTASHLIASNEFTPSESMIDWRSGKPNARYHARKLICDHFIPGDVFVATSVTGPRSQRMAELFQLTQIPDIDLLKTKEVAVQGIATERGNRILVVNKTRNVINVALSGIGRVVHADIVDEESGKDPARRETQVGSELQLKPFAIAVLTIDDKVSREN